MRSPGVLAALGTFTAVEEPTGNAMKLVFLSVEWVRFSPPPL